MKTLTLRIDDETYNLLNKAAKADRRTISNYIEYAAMKFTFANLYVSDSEMQEIKKSLPYIIEGLNEAKEGKYIVIG